MTNYEHFKDEIDKIWDAGENVAIVNGKPVSCQSTKCRSTYDLSFMCDLGFNCSAKIQRWLVSEYIEPEKTINASELDDDAKVFVSMVGNDLNTAVKRHFAKNSENNLATYYGVTSSWTCSNKIIITNWNHMWTEDGIRVIAGQ